MLKDDHFLVDVRVADHDSQLKYRFFLPDRIEEGSVQMAFLNLGVKALLSWVNNIILAHREINIEELRDGEFLLRVVHKLKKEPNPPLIQSTEERFKVIAEFVENDCRFSPTKGTSLSWDNIRNGINLTVEIAKVLLLLVYHDMMSERCTLKTLDCEVEREIANLTISFVMESHGSVFLSSGLDAYLAKRYLPVPPEILAQTASTSTSSVSTASIPSDEDSPVLHRTKKITFVDMHTVASSSVSNSPLQDIMNTPKLQLRKMQRQMIKEQDYRDGLEKELADKISLITQRESHINQLQYRLDKMKQEQSDQELTAKEQINELETKNNSLQLRLHEILKDNKDCKSNFLLMERKVNELEEENGVLSSQMRRANAQLSIFQAEVGRLTETLASGQEEWKAKMDYLQSELGQATAQKEHLAEQIQILQGKISCLQDEITLATKQDVGENMGSVMEKNMRSAASTFGVGAENEPEGAPDDWMRIAELQARNKACLPHLKSSYPAEFEAGCKSVLPFTDEDVRTGDPTETIRRASVMLGQPQDSLASHCHSLAAVHASTAAGIRSHRLSLMADHPTSKSVSSSQLKSQRFTKRAASTLCVPQTSPEKKLKASCFPRPLTPKNKNINSGPFNSQLDPVLSPVNRRQSMMFTIDNTPNKSSNNYLKRGLNKLRSSTRKSPSNTSKNAMQKENKHAAVSLAAAGRAGRGGSSRSPQVICKENRKSPKTTSKSPRLMENPRKMRRRMV